jgi:GAF domain-containing protein
VADRIWATLEHYKAEAELRADEERLAFLLRLNDTLRPLSDPAAVLESAARLLAEHLGVTRVGYAELGRRMRHPSRARLVRRWRDKHCRAHSVGTARGVSARRNGRQNDVASDPRFTEAERAAVKERQMAAFIGVTLIKGGRMVAAFGANNVTAGCGRG